MRKAVAALLLVLLLPAYALARRDQPPEEYGRVVIDNYSRQARLAPVVFDHWLHRAIYTCRLCHVDIGFAMEANQTSITQQTNMSGFYCGACHDGQKEYEGRKIFRACSDRFMPEEAKVCDRCHSQGLGVKRQYDFGVFTQKFPKAGLGNKVDWEKAEEEGLIKPIDFIKGISIKRPKLKAQEDFSIDSRGTWMSDVIFSHKKHAVWNGCEVCHPEIFPSVKKGDTKYTMLEIFEGFYCGACHEKVAFSLYDCQRCHVNPVQQP